MKARRIGVDTLTMPENFRIEDGPDPNQTKIKKLEQENRELKSSAPDLSLLFENGDKRKLFKLVKPVLLSENEIEEKIAEKKSALTRNAKEEESQKFYLPDGELGTELFKTFLSSGRITKEEVERFNSDFDKYIPKYKEFLIKDLDYDNLIRRIIELKILLTNNGTAPAEDIDIYLYFPTGFQHIVDMLEDLEDDLPNPPEPPTPPEALKTDLQIMVESMRSGIIVQSPELHVYNQAFSHVQPLDTSDRRIKCISNTEVQVHVQKIKHNFQEPLDPLFVIFNDYESAKSFNINYRILAANIPHEITGSLNVVIEKE